MSMNMKGLANKISSKNCVAKRSVLTVSATRKVSTNKTNKQTWNLGL